MSGIHGKPIPRPFKTLFFRAAAWALWGCAAGSPALAQNLTSTPIEMWYGVRRIDGVASVKAQGNPQQDSAIRPAAANKGQEDISAPVPSSPLPKPAGLAELPPMANVPALASPAPAGVVQAGHAVVPADSPGLPVAPARVDTTSTLPGRDKLSQPAAPLASVSAPHNEPSAPLPQPATHTSSSPGANAPEQPAPSPPAAGTASTGQGFYRITMAHLICALFAVIAAPLLAVLCFWVLLRRHSTRHGPLFRVEFSSPPANVPAMPAASFAMTQSGPAPAAPAPAPATHAETFAVGPAYGDVTQQDQQGLRLHEQGILRHLVDQNLRLREEIGELETVALS